MIFATFPVSLNVGGMSARISAVFVMFLLPFIAAAATCPSGYSEFSVNDGHMIVPMSEQCPDGLVQLYTVSDCADADAGAVCATCGSGYALGNSASCVELCSADFRQIHFGNKLSFNLLKKPGTKPALNFLTQKNKVCYVDLASGTASGLNFELPNGTQYHAVNNSGGYRVCAAGYTLDYDCGVGGGVPPESQSLLSGYWYTIPSGAGSCRVPEGMRFSGWYMDGKKQAPYTIHSYNFNMNKTLTAMFSDLSNYKVNYFCSANDAVPVYSDDVVVGESVAPQSNMCTANPDKVESLLAWIEPLSQEEINAMVALGLDLSDTSDFGFFASYFGVGDGLIKSEVEELVFLLVLSVHLSCINDPEYQADNPESCALAKMFFEHTYFPNFDALIGSSDVDDDTQAVLQMLYKEIASETDVDLYPLFIPTLYNMTWDCGDYFSVYGGYDFDGTTRYGWTVNYRCEPSYNHGYGDLYGVSFVGWEVDGVLYEGNKLTYNWTEDKTAIGIFDYDLNATFDCGEYGTLSSGESTVTYSGRGNAKDKIPLNVSAQCTPYPGKKFIGWKANNTETVYHVDDTLDWVKTLKENCGYYNYCEYGLNFTAVYEDLPIADVNYYCSVDDTNPVYVDEIFYGGIDVKTNMCPYDIKTTESFAWIKPFTSQEVSSVETLLQSGVLGNNTEVFANTIYDLYVVGQDAVRDRAQWLSFAMLYEQGLACAQSTDVQVTNTDLCKLALMIYNHTYFESPDIVGEKYYKKIFSETDVDLRPLLMPAEYTMKWDCGNYFSPSSGDLNFDSDPRYGWKVLYYCADRGWSDYSFGELECSEIDADGYCLDSRLAIQMYGWDVDGEVYERDSMIYKWTEDKTATAVLDYDLSAKFDCGDFGTLASGEEIVTYTGRKKANETISLGINAVCEPNNQVKKFVGWKLINDDTVHSVGDTINWLDAFLLSNTLCAYQEGCQRLTFTAVYEDVMSYYMNYYCSVDDAAPTYTAEVSPYTDVALPKDICEYDEIKYQLSTWFVPFTDNEIAELQAYGVSFTDDIDELEAVFINKTSNKIVKDIDGFAVLLALRQYNMSTGNAGLDYLAELLEKHIIFKDTVFASGNMDLHALYTGHPYNTEWTCGDIARLEHYMQFSANYGAEFKVDSACVFDSWLISGVVDFAGWNIDGKLYQGGDSFVWEYPEDKTFVGMYDYNLKATFDCGENGTLSSGNSVVTYSGRGNGKDKIPLNVSAQCKPNAGKKFVGWSLPYYSSRTFGSGSVIDWLNIIVARNEQGIENPSDDFVAVYEDVVDVNYYCSVSDTLPTYTNQYSANTTSAPLRQSGCSYDTKKYELFGWYTPFAADEVAKLKSYSFDTKYPEYWAVIEPMFVSQSSDYALDRNVLFVLAGMWSMGPGSSSDMGVNYLAELLQKHWFIKGYTTTLSLSGNTNLYAFYTGKPYLLDFDCGIGEYEFWDDMNTGYYGATQKLCDSCRLGGYSNGSVSFVGWEIDGNVYEQCEPFVWEWTQNKVATGIYQYDMTANFDCGADGVLSSGDAIVKNNARGNSTNAIPLNITAQCKPNSGKKFVGWSNNGKTYNVGQTLNWLDYVGESLIEFTAVYEDVIDVNYYCSAADAVPTFTEQYPADTTSVTMRKSGCSYDTGTYQHMNWFTPFTDEEVAKLKSYSFHTKHSDFWAVIEPTFVNQSNSFVEDYDIVFMMAGLYAGRGLDTNDAGVKYLTELLQKHWYFISETSTIPVTGNTNLYAFYVNYL